MHLPINRLAALLVTLIVLSTGCGDDETSGDTTTTDADAADTGATAPTADDTASADAVATDQVTVVGFAFDPASIVVDTGTTVVWTNEDETVHTVTPVDDPTAFGGGLDTAGAVVEATFDEAGTFEYFCSIHPSMTGVVTVSA